MPIYDYSCRDCGNQFEKLIRDPRRAVVCPKCQSHDLERLLSLPTVQSQSTKDVALRAARTRDAGQAKEREHAQREYERNHDK